MVDHLGSLSTVSEKETFLIKQRMSSHRESNLMSTHIWKVNLKFSHHPKLGQDYKRVSIQYVAPSVPKKASQLGTERYNINHKICFSKSNR